MRPVKTRAGSRDLPLIGLARGALRARKEQQADRMKLGSAWIDTGLLKDLGVPLADIDQDLTARPVA